MWSCALSPSTDNNTRLLSWCYYCYYRYGTINITNVITGLSHLYIVFSGLSCLLIYCEYIITYICIALALDYHMRLLVGGEGWASGLFVVLFDCILVRK